MQKACRRHCPNWRVQDESQDCQCQPELLPSASVAFSTVKTFVDSALSSSLTMREVTYMACHLKTVSLQHSSITHKLYSFPSAMHDWKCWSRTSGH